MKGKAKQVRGDVKRTAADVVDSTKTKRTTRARA
jgi:hypothetical protein